MCKLCEQKVPSLSRRAALVGVGAALAMSALPFGRAQAADEPPADRPNAITPEAALQRLIEGNQRYAANATEVRDFSASRAERAAGQYPIAAIVGCSDSRVVPDLVFDQNPGDLFVVRVAGNFLNDDGLASLEYAVHFLKVPLVMVLGHSSCGAVAAAVKVVTERAELPGHLPDMIKSIEPAVIAAHDRHSSDLVAAAIEENVRLNVKRMLDDKPILSDALESKTIAATGGVYDIATGKVKLI